MVIKRASINYRKRYCFEGLSNGNVDNMIQISESSFDLLEYSLYPYVQILTLYYKLYLIMKDSWQKYSRFIRIKESQGPICGDLDMDIILNKYEDVLVDYILKSSLLVNNIRTRNCSIIQKEYNNLIFVLFTLVRNLLEHNQIPLKRVSIKENPRNNIKKFISFIDANVLIQFIHTKFQRRNKKHVRNNMHMIKHFIREM